MTPQEKQKAVNILSDHFNRQQLRVYEIDPRLSIYMTGLSQQPELHSGWEILCAVRFLRLLRTYDLNIRKVKQVIKLREGTWKKDKNDQWQHVSGGMKQPLTTGDKVVRWEPFQIATIAYIFGPSAWIDTQITIDDRQQLQSTERVNEENGHIEDHRRMCTNFTFFGPRKIDKTGISAFISQVFFLLEDNNSEVYCCSNSADQSKILYRRIKHGLSQLDPSGSRFHMTEKVTDWKPSYHSIRNSSISPLSAGGRTKDGMFAHLCCADEYGSAQYTNGKCDMKRLVDVVESSMGPRREPLTIITTTAGRITTGPFMEKLESLHRLLLHEFKYETGEEQPSLSADRVSCILFEPDDWEKHEDVLFTERNVRHKINPMLGKIVQHSFYDDAVVKGRMDGDMSEVKTKLFNVYDATSKEEWVRASQVRPLQRDQRIDQCKAANGWVVFTGLDFSQGDDLHTASYLAARKHPSGRGTEFFADCDCWIKESTLQKSSIRPLYEQWIEQGWLHVSQGEVFQPALFINRLDELLKAGVQFMYFGYDKYQSHDPINTLKAYLQSTWKIANPEPYVQVVSQLNAEFNAPTDDLYAAMFAPEPFISFSHSPLWPWCFQNCVLEIDGRDNKRPVKRSQSDSCKVDPIQALIEAMDLYTRYEGSMH